MLRRMVLTLFVVLPGLAAVVVCGHYMFQDWSALISAFARLERAIQGGNPAQIASAQAIDGIFRLNAFADGVGVMLGALLFAVGVHGLCLLPPEPVRAEATSPARNRTTTLAAVAVLLVAFLGTSALLGSLVVRVGQTNALRRAVIRGDASMVRTLVRQGANPRDALWWGTTPLEAARTQAPAESRKEILALLNRERASR